MTLRNNTRDARRPIIGVGFTGLLFLLFLGLKLAGSIDWKWIWVFAPLWIPLAVVLFIGAVIILAAFFQALPILFKRR